MELKNYVNEVGELVFPMASSMRNNNFAVVRTPILS